MSKSDFEILLKKVGPKIERRNTQFREAILASVRLAVTLRYLVTGDTFTSLMYTFKISKQSISNIVPEVCEALIHALRDLVKKIRMLSVIVKAAVLVCFIQFSIEAADPCIPNYFRYIADKQAGEFNGHIEIPSPPKRIPLELRVTLGIAVSLQTKYNGKLELAQSRKQSVTAVEQGTPLRYNINFPVQHPLPTVTKIWLNNRLICTDPGATEQTSVTSIVLKHTLYPPGIIALSVDDQNMIPSSLNAIDASLPEDPPVQSTVSNKPPTTVQFTRPTQTNLPIQPTQTTPPVRPSPPTQPNLPSTPNPPVIDYETTSQCGHSKHIGINYLIIRGTETVPGEWPWLVAIFRQNFKYSNYTFICAGSLITDKHIITAAHCVYQNNLAITPFSLLVSLGRYQLFDFHEKGSVNQVVVDYKVHPDYNPTQAKADSDIAILFTLDRVEYNDRIKPICLWSRPPDLNLVVGSKGIVVGWGRDEHGNQYLQEPKMINAPIVSQEDCLRSSEEYVRITSNRTFCAGGMDGTGPCNGDSGGSFILYDTKTKRFYLRGVVSLSLIDQTSRSCDLKQLVVYVDAAKYLDWILATVLAETKDLSALSSK
ncbi:PREDICTED: serine protease gd-like [Dufourea novaeangliae]|uniref:serine protease gd-like n=1 Tax=Dufourea novaeangliae TaxID=178035 RepID=UPI00076733FD|nr:PREDICTED: serine protease gd-like [Dufourea novaeangliae]